MSSITVEYIDHMGDDRSVVNAARVSFNKWKDEFDELDARLLNYLAKHKHFSPFCHVQISIRCKTPVFLARQLQKHTVGLSWNEVSRRYVDSSPEFYCPLSWRNRPDGSLKQGSGEDFKDQRWVDDNYRLLVTSCSDFYDDLVNAGVAPEQARMVLPQSMLTEWIWTGSVMAFTRVYGLRIDGHAQKEAQEFAAKLAEVVEPIYPLSWRALNANC